MRTTTLVPQTLVSFALATAVLLSGVLGAIDPGLALGVGAALALLGALALARDVRERQARRDAADELIEHLPGDRVPEALAWRADELTSDRERRRLARSLRWLLTTIEGSAPLRLSPVPLNWRALRRQRRTMEEIASLLADTRRPVSPRGVVLTRRLILDSLESPIYNRHHAGELARALERVRDALSAARD
jgi:hypothetical protein